MKWNEWMHLVLFGGEHKPVIRSLALPSIRTTRYQLNPDHAQANSDLTGNWKYRHSVIGCSAISVSRSSNHYFMSRGSDVRREHHHSKYRLCCVCSTLERIMPPPPAPRLPVSHWEWLTLSFIQNPWIHNRVSELPCIAVCLSPSLFDRKCILNDILFILFIY